ncbi:Scr1 family TA system antitoxin-like transcriptional regulator [Streptomyces tendae]|uniref:Scr1 family TA system antitoxin-like transcriptional regulator n=1 Tax=Streptomyces tendae TaxID=1932 RepID=UPI00368EF6BC
MEAVAAGRDAVGVHLHGRRGRGVRTWQQSFVPGLLQTPEYTRALWSVRGSGRTRTRSRASSRSG